MTLRLAKVLERHHKCPYPDTSQSPQLPKYHSCYYASIVVVIVSRMQHNTSPLLVTHLIIQLPECCRPNRSVVIIIFIEPGSNCAASGSQATNLYRFTLPAFFAAEQRGSCPTNFAFWGEGCGTFDSLS